jgi:hypothetical protein
MALTIPYHRITPWWHRVGPQLIAAWELTVAAARGLAAARVRLWRWLLADPARFRAATRGLAACLVVGAVLGWLAGAVLTETIAAAVHEIRTGP